LNFALVANISKEAKFNFILHAHFHPS
jgi:hypothetical protein